MYFPYAKGRYEVAIGLSPLSRDFGNGEIDQKIFQFGSDESVIRLQRETNRKAYPRSQNLCFALDADPVALQQISGKIIQRLAEEYPQRKLPDVNLHSSPFEKWEAVAGEVSEDLAVWRLNADGSEILEAISLEAPNHWAPEEKIGKSFASIHAPVAHMENMVPEASKILKGIISKAPMVRFAWGVGTDANLNHHPGLGKFDPSLEGRLFDPDRPELYVRVERQVLWGFPELNRALFTIRTYFQDVKVLAEKSPDKITALREAIKSMSDQSLQYKGVAQSRDPVIRYLSALAEPGNPHG